jgi:MFS family permease
MNWEEGKILIDLKKRKFLKYLLFADLYFPQGFSNMAVPLIALYFIDIGIPIEYITLIIGIGSIPWIIKFIWSGPIDKYVNKGRKFFVFIGGLIGAFSFFLLYFIDPLNLIILFAIILFFSQIGQTLLDSAADAWGIDISIDKDRGKINAAMNIGKIVGIILGAITLTYVAQTFGHKFMFIVAGIMILICTILPSMIAEAKKIIRKQKVKELFLKEFKKKYVKLLLFLIPLMAIGYGIFNYGIEIYAKIVLELSDFQIGLLLASAYVFAIPGSMLAGIISDKFGRKKAIYLFVIPAAIFVILMIFSNSITTSIIIIFITTFFGLGANAAGLAFYMDATNPKIGGTQFSFYTGIANLGMGSAGMITGSIIVLLGYNYMFLIAGLICIPPLILLHFVHIEN